MSDDKKKIIQGNYRMFCPYCDAFFEKKLRYVTSGPWPGRVYIEMQRHIKTRHKEVIHASNV